MQRPELSDLALVADMRPVSRRLAGATLVALLYSIGLLAQRVPLASDADKALAPLSISADGKTFTLRGTAPDDAQVCVEPSIGRFGRRRCYALSDLRAGMARK